MTPTALRSALADGEEIALVDVREAGSFGARHILLANNLPLSRLELDLRRLIPRQGTRIVLCDGGSGLAERAAPILAAAGYGDVAILEGGVEGWAAAGFEIFSGTNVPSKAFGEVVELRYHTPNIAAEDLGDLQARGEKLVILDSRPMAEFGVMNIPGGIDVPGAELAYRVHDLAPDPDTFVVVNCAGRTRSIIGCQSLVNAGIPNRVAALTNGTMGWHLAGLELEHGASRSYGAMSESGGAKAREVAARVAARFGVKQIDRQTLETWRGERDDHSLYVFDVRSPEEYRAGHMADAVSAPGGQLVQATDEYLAVRAGRVVLVDDTEVRATMTASWLNQMAFPEVYVLTGGIGGEALTTGDTRPARPEVDAAAVKAISPADLAAQGETWTVVDVGASKAHKTGHIPGAWWASRARIADWAPEVRSAERIAVTCDDAGDLARLTARDLAGKTEAEVAVVEGGTAAWRALGQPLETGLDRSACECDDHFELPYDKDRGVEAAMEAYITWEIGLVEQLERDATLVFPSYPSTSP